MLTITVPATEGWDERTERFVHTQAATLVLEHSLVSLSKWEAKFKKAFLSNEEKTTEETYAYIQAMSLNGDISMETLACLTNENVAEINAYIESPMGATTFHEVGTQRRSREKVTAAIIWHWMIALNIPLEFETRHLNILFTQIRVENEKNSPKKKMSRQEAMAQQRRLNAERQKQYATTG